jgi:hypothetical protein
MSMNSTDTWVAEAIARTHYEAYEWSGYAGSSR